MAEGTAFALDRNFHGSNVPAGEDFRENSPLENSREVHE
jgi:hypothetical protein